MKKKTSTNALCTTLQKELSQYKAQFNYVSKEMQDELLEWVNSGNSVYTNPYAICDERGFPMDYITAVQIAQEMRET